MEDGSGQGLKHGSLNELRCAVALAAARTDRLGQTRSLWPCWLAMQVCAEDQARAASRRRRSRMRADAGGADGVRQAWWGKRRANDEETDAVDPRTGSLSD